MRRSRSCRNPATSAVKPLAAVVRRLRGGSTARSWHGDRRGLPGFFAQHYERLCRLGFLLTADPAQAEELAQEALVRTWRRWRLVGKPDNPETYARKVLVNRHRSLLRRALVEARHLYRDRPRRGGQ
jgi:DNA-directed RNA polymerase specialized sigma24 family protein